MELATKLPSQLAHWCQPVPMLCTMIELLMRAIGSLTVVVVSLNSFPYVPDQPGGGVDGKIGILWLQVLRCPTPPTLEPAVECAGVTVQCVGAWPLECFQPARVDAQFRH